EMSAADKFLAREIDGDALLRQQSENRHPHRRHERNAQRIELGAGAQVLEHGAPSPPFGNATAIDNREVATPAWLAGYTLRGRCRSRGSERPAGATGLSEGA